MKVKPRRNLASQPAITPALQYGTAGEFQAEQQKKIAELSARLAGVERRYNVQQRRIGVQETFIASLKAEAAEARKRLRFLENSAKLEPLEQSKSVAMKLRGGQR